MSDVSVGGGNKATSLWVDDIGSNTLDRAQKLLAGARKIRLDSCAPRADVQAVNLSPGEINCPNMT